MIRLKARFKEVSVLSLETKILSNIFYDSQYALKILPYTKEEYFDNGVNKNIIRLILKYFVQFNSVPNKDQIAIDSKEVNYLSDKDVKDIAETLDALERDTSDRNWLVKKTEEFYRFRALGSAIIKGATILESKDEGNQKKILTLVQDALGVSFNNTIGHSYFNDYISRFEAYHEKEDKIPTGIEALDEITRGGFSRKSLNCFMGASGSGKSMILVSCACDALRQGYNVLYITLEMSDIRIAERVDCNLMDVTAPRLSEIDLKGYSTKIENLKDTISGNLIIKEYPTGSSSVLHFRTLLNELAIKQNFIPDVICVDYINLMTSSRYKAGLVNSYSMIKAISEELRGLAVETNTAILTATQTNRSGFNNSDIEVTEVSDSVGLVFTLDLFLALIRTDALDAQNKIIIKQLKNRYSDLNKKPTFNLGFNMDFMRLYDIDASDYRTDESVYTPKRKMETISTGARSKNDFGSFKF